MLHKHSAMAIAVRSVDHGNHISNLGSRLTGAWRRTLRDAVFSALASLAEARGREPILLLGLGAVGVRAILFALLSNPWTLLPAQLLDWLCAAVIGVMMPLVIADLTRGTGRYNLARGFAGTATGIGAAQHHVLRLCGPVLLICRRPSRPGP